MGKVEAVLVDDIAVMGIAEFYKMRYGSEGIET